MARRAAWVMIVAALGVWFPSTPVAAAPGAAPQAPTCAERDPFTPALRDHLSNQWPDHGITAAVHDDRTGCRYLLHPERRLTTASVVKIEILAGVLLRAQREGRDLTRWELDRIVPMITRSADPPASELWRSLGGVAGMAALDRELGLTETTPAGPAWGLTRTSAADQVHLIRQLIVGEFGPFSVRSRDLARFFMSAVVPEQRWGVTAGVPPGWSVPLKNGFFSSQCCRWRINSVGRVDDPAGGGYSVAILSDRWPDDRSGIAVVDLISRAVARRLATVPYPPFPDPAGFVTQLHRDVHGREPSYPELDLWTAAAGHGPARAPGIIASFLESPAAGPARSIVRLYLAAFARPPDRAGFEHWLTQVRSGRATVGSVAAAFSGAPEFQSHTGSLDDAAFVDDQYDRVLGRSADVAGRRYWNGRLAAGLPRGQLVLRVAESPEYVAQTRAPVTVIHGYDALLGRMPDPAGYRHWSNIVAGAATADGFAAHLFASTEYRQRFPGG